MKLFNFVKFNCTCKINMSCVMLFNFCFNNVKHIIAFAYFLMFE